MSVPPSLPIASSAKNTTTATPRVSIIYNKIKAEPPLLPTIVGNFHALPRPTALPAIARINPIFENFSTIFHLKYKIR